MLKWAAIFFVVALVAAMLGFTGIAGAAASIAKFLFFLFLVVFLVLLVMGIFVGKKIPSRFRIKYGMTKLGIQKFHFSKVFLLHNIFKFVILNRLCNRKTGLICKKLGRNFLPQLNSVAERSRRNRNILPKSNFLDFYMSKNCSATSSSSSTKISTAFLAFSKRVFDFSRAACEA